VISVVVTVRDDREELALLLDALAAQTTPPAEVVIVDGGSTDGTRELAAGWQPDREPVRLIDAPGANISAGRNIGIEATASDWIACTDAGCRPVEGWLAAFDERRDQADLLAGIYVVSGQSDFERALAVALYPHPDEIGDDSPFVTVWQRLFGKRYEAERAATRSIAFTKDAWRAAGGFPEHVYAGEDPAFSQAVVASGLRVELVPDAVVLWRPRPSWRANARMYHSYARGSLATGAYARHVVRALAWGALPWLALRGGRLGRLTVLAWWAAYLSLPVRRARRIGMPPGSWWRLPLVIALKDLSQVAGAASGARDMVTGRSEASEKPGTGRPPTPQG
jgi:glycosyltransferase involved in cell wall biosynthesis